MVAPPFKTAGPIVSTAITALSLFDPCAVCSVLGIAIVYLVDQIYLGNKEGVADVDAVVDAEPDGEDDVDARDDVDGDPPEVEEADDVGEGE